ncbi:hypothetical protein CFC21_054049 [Triticum aestivum]|uniref:Uncharacterized protein n=2 Tax=Triticum aestivum TaxID=4565 RepID=A0A3B6HYR3_WHEAT|nr:hypothetical protein CFC21_054049 [Triticum aestivum]
MGGRRRRNSRREHASAPEAGGDRALLEREASEGGEILRRKKEMMEAMAATDLSPGTKPATEPAGAGKKKRKKMVKTRLPQALIKQMMASPYRPMPIPDDELAKRPRYYREFYATAMDRADKVAAYQRALVNQYVARGYAEDEEEVTDDESEEN